MVSLASSTKYLKKKSANTTQWDTIRIAKKKKKRYETIDTGGGNAKKKKKKNTERATLKKTND